MNYRQRRFVAEYMVDGDRTAAAIRAGYKPRSARGFAHKLMRDAQVHFAIGQGLAERAARTGVTRERVLLEYARLALGNLGRVAIWRGNDFALVARADLSDDEAATIAELACDPKGRVRVRLHDKDFALGALARHFGLYDGPPEEPVQGARERLMERIAKLAPAADGE